MLKWFSYQQTSALNAGKYSPDIAALVTLSSLSVKRGLNSCLFMSANSIAITNAKMF
jgi:hypothetical protein